MTTQTKNPDSHTVNSLYHYTWLPYCYADFCAYSATAVAAHPQLVYCSCSLLVMHSLITWLLSVCLSASFLWQTTDSSDGSSDDDSSESSDVSMDADDAEPAAAAQPQHQPVMLQVTPTADGHVSVMLTVNNKLSSTETNGRVMTHHDDAMDRGEGNSSDAAEDTTSSDSSSSDGCSSSIEEAEDPVGGLLAGPDITSYAEMRDMIDRAYR